MSSASKYKLEYVWLDGYLPEPNLRSKTKIVDKAPASVADLPVWGFDGSSHPTGRRPQFGLRSEAGCPVSGQHAEEWLPGDVRSVVAQQLAPPVEFPIDH